MPGITDRVSSKTIGDTSKQSQLKGSFKNKAVPDYDKVVRRIRNDLKRKIKEARETQERMKEDFSFETDRNVEDPFEKRLRNLLHLENEFEHYLEKEVPEGFEIVPVLINPVIDQKKLEYTSNEFIKKVRTDFIKHVAETEADILRQHGVSKHAIALMKTGHIMTGALPFNVDHILERANSELFSTEKALDPNNPRAKEPVLKINHFNNLMLIPEETIHEFKNALKGVQCEIYSGDDKARYFLMLAPKEGPDGIRHYISPPQSPYSEYSFKGLSDQEVTRDTIKLVSMKTTREILEEETCEVALDIIYKEMNKAIEKAEKPSDRRVTHTVALDNIFFKNDNMKRLYARLDAANHPMKEDFRENIEKIKKILHPKQETKKKIVKKSKKPNNGGNACRKKKVVAVKRKKATTNSP